MVSSCSQSFAMVAASSAGTNLKLWEGVTYGARRLKKIVVPLHFLALKVQLVVLVSAFVIVNTVFGQFLVFLLAVPSHYKK